MSPATRARWVTVSPAGARVEVVLKRARREHERAMVGRCDGAPVLTLGTADVGAAYGRLRGLDVRFLGAPHSFPGGVAPGPGRQPDPPAANAGPGATLRPAYPDVASRITFPNTVTRMAPREQVRQRRDGPYDTPVQGSVAPTAGGRQ